MLFLEKKNDVTIMYSDRTRHAPITKDKAPAFRWCDEAKAHVSCEQGGGSTIGRPATETKGQNIQKGKALAKELITKSAWKIEDLKERLAIATGITRPNDLQAMVRYAEESAEGIDRVRAQCGKRPIHILGRMKDAHELKQKIEKEYQENRQAKLQD